MNCQLIVNADDFGLTRGVNAAVAQCARSGFLRSATIMANGTAFEDAVQTVAALPRFGVGIHFVLTKLRPVGDPDRLPILTGRTGRLPSGPAELLKLVLTRRDVLAEISTELTAQAEKVRNAGICPTHFDSHKHVHIIPAVLDAMIALASKFSVAWIRNPFERPDALRFLFDLEKDTKEAFCRQYALGLGSNAFRRAFTGRLRRAGISCPDRFHGVAATGLLTEELLARLLRTLKPGLHELMTHPGYLDEDLVREKTRLLESRRREAQLLCSERLNRLIERRGISLCRFAEVNR